jgi:iron-sulfur cluster repair protein YtfE (RIC family)
MGQPSQPSNEQRRHNLLMQHQALRGVMAELKTRAEEVLLDNRDPAALHASLRRLHEAFERHLASEEELLEPILERIDAWGPLRLELLRAEHAHQRAVLHALRSAEAMRAPEVVARRAVALAEELLADMDAEERELLDARVLRDDAISIEFGG